MPQHLLHHHRIAFIGGGNMASAILGGLLRSGITPQQLLVVEPFAPARERLLHDHGITAHAQAGDFLRAATMVVWAVKPQHMHEATLPVAAHTTSALHLSIAAGITCATLARWTGSQRLVRAMPNTPALIGQGMTGLYACADVTDTDRALVDALLQATGQRMWLTDEAQLDAVTAISGSGPAYVFYWMEALICGGQQLGLSAAQSQQLAAQTFAGAAALVQASTDSPEVLRQRVTSKGGTTHEAITVMQQHHIDAHIIEAMHACQRRAQDMGQEFQASAATPAITPATNC